MAYGQKILKGDAYKRAAIKRRHIRIRKRISGTRRARPVWSSRPRIPQTWGHPRLVVP
ncbi:hypothetical protein SGLAM104S_05221 [Streptomyces glaucescens]